MNLKATNFETFTYWTYLKFIYSEKAKKVCEISILDLTVLHMVNSTFSKCQIDGEDFVNICGLLRKYEL